MIYTLRFWLAGLVAVLLAIDIVLGRLPLLFLAFYAVAGLVAFVLFGIDKRAAERGEWRIPERTLHTLDIAFGIVGGLLAQQIFRHKTSKPEFVTFTWAITALHVLGLVLVLLRLLDPQAIVDALQQAN